MVQLFVMLSGMFCGIGVSSLILLYFDNECDKPKLSNRTIFGFGMSIVTLAIAFILYII